MKEKHKKAYMDCCKAFAECSDDTKLHVGSVIVKNNRIVSCGYNAHTQHITAPNQLSDGTTDQRVRHSEKNALMGLIRSNESAVGATMFCTHACCYLCSIDIVDAGITHFIYESDYRSNDGIEHLLQNGVMVEKFNSGVYELVTPNLDFEHISCGEHYQYSLDMAKESGIIWNFDDRLKLGGF